MCKTEKSHISHDILAYLAKHQDAQDTLEGIVDWWLMEQRVIQQAATIQEVLDELVAQKLVLEFNGQDSRKRYRMNHRKTKEIMARLGQKPE